jgi:hypothetical protein
MYDMGRVIVLDRNDVRRNFQKLPDSQIRLEHIYNITGKDEETASVILFRGDNGRLWPLKDRTYGFLLVT